MVSALVMVLPPPFFSKGTKNTSEDYFAHFVVNSVMQRAILQLYPELDTTTCRKIKGVNILDEGPHPGVREVFGSVE